MIAKALFFLLLALSLGFVLNGLRKKEGIFQFPVLFAGAFAFSIVPQLVNHVFYPGRLPARVYQDHGVEYGLIMCILCLVAGIAGYRGMPRTRCRRPVPRTDVDKLFWAGTVLCLAGVLGVVKRAALTGGLKAELTEGGHYALEWSGAPVFWTYVILLLVPGLILCLNSTLIKSTVGKWMFTFLMMAYPLTSIVFLGRRSMVFTMGTIIVTSIWFQRRWAPPRWLSLGGMTLGGILIILLPYYRGYANQTGDIKGAITRIDPTSAMEAYATGEKGEGMDNLIVGIPSRLAYPSYFWGSSFWNAVVACFVPGQIVGYGLKQGLMINIGAGEDEIYSRYCGMTWEYGAFATGPYSAFREFCFAGCLLYFFLGRFFRWLWPRANHHRDLVAQIIYVPCTLVAPMAVVNSVPGAFARALLPVSILYVGLWLIRSRRMYPSHHVAICQLQRQI
jgi:hypothetical protein